MRAFLLAFLIAAAVAAISIYINPWRQPGSGHLPRQSASGSVTSTAILLGFPGDLAKS